MPDIPLHELWMAAIVIRGLSLLTWRTARPWWLAWVSFSAVSSLYMRWLDSQHNPVYRDFWIAEQIINVILLACVTWEECRPFISLVAASGLVSLLATAGLHPSAGLPLVMWFCGVSLLSLGVICTITAIHDRKPSQCVLAVYLMCSCLLMLAGQDYLDQAGLGRAWSLLEVLAFMGWIGIGTWRWRTAQ